MKAASRLFGRFALAAERRSPRLNDLLGDVITGAARLQRQSVIARREVITLQVGETRFRLCLVPGHPIAHSDYVPLVRDGGVYEPVATACLTRLLRRVPEPVFMDVGAFLGYFTCYAAALFGHTRPVFAVESNPVFCDAIRQGVALNGFSRVQVLQAALSDRPGIVTVEDTAVLPGHESGPGRQAVQATTLDDLCTREGIAPTIVKIDVHGAEGKVLLGMSRVLRESVEVIVLELHALRLYEPHSPGFTRLELLDWLEQTGFSVFCVAGHRSAPARGVATSLEHDRFAYVPVTRATRELLLFDRPLDVLIVACKRADVGELLGPSIDLSTAVG